jgi:hypothetical protein
VSVAMETPGKDRPAICRCIAHYTHTTHTHRQSSAQIACTAYPHALGRERQTVAAAAACLPGGECEARLGQARLAQKALCVCEGRPSLQLQARRAVVGDTHTHTHTAQQVQRCYC